MHCLEVCLRKSALKLTWLVWFRAVAWGYDIAVIEFSHPMFPFHFQKGLNGTIKVKICEWGTILHV